MAESSGKRMVAVEADDSTAWYVTVPAEWEQAIQLLNALR
ncbi:hypothetical protein JOF41_003565 [Saccharothrix coeruleofusca]|nr:hypothetical protein [Saccharothrix coeruleofusca]